MAHPQPVKTPKLNALLIGKRTVPSGCRVLNASQQGMSLQCDPDGRLLTFVNGDAVDIYLSVQHTSGHNKFTIPAIVSHVDASTIDVVFHCTDPELAGLIESYRTSESHNLEASIDRRKTSRKGSMLRPVAVKESASYNAQPDGPTSQSNRLFSSGLFALFITSLVLIGGYYYVSSINKRLNTLETIIRSHADELDEVQTQVLSSRIQDGRYASLNARMKALTDAFLSFEKRITQTTLSQDPVIVTTAEPELVKEPTVAPRHARKPIAGAQKPQAEPGKKTAVPVEKGPKTTPPPAREAPAIMTEKQTIEEPGTPSPQKAPSIRIKAATPAATTPPQTVPQAVPSTMSQGKPGKTETKQTPASKQESAARPAAPPVVIPVATPIRTEKPASIRTGPWVINLISSPDKAYVNKVMSDVRSKGFDVVVQSATVKGRQYWRLQAPGFGSMAEAKTAAKPIKKQLKIKDVWIFKR